ncbi:MAG: hypothetical protein QXJ99_01355 [Thermofilum sp.]
MEVQKLRCTNCGAPLPKPQPGDEWIRCEYCGYTNRLVDSSKYVNELKQELERWVRDILPPAIVTSTTVDTAARYQIFQSIIKPRVSLTRSNVRARYLQCLSHPIVPFMASGASVTDDSKQFFEEALKIESLKDFAVTEDDQRMLSETLAYETIAGHLLNALRTLSVNDVKMALKNVAEALQLLPDVPGFSLVRERLRAVHAMLSAVNELMNRNTSSSLTLIRDSISLYNSLLQRISGKALPEANPGILEIEKLCAESLANIVDSANRLFTAGEDPLKVLEWFERYAGLFNRLRETYRRPMQDLLEVTSHVRNVVYSKTGLGEVDLVRGSGTYHIPYYIVETKFSYVKGLLLRKGAESSMMLMVTGIAPYALNPVVDALGVQAGRPVPPDRVHEAPAHILAGELLTRKVRANLPPRARTVPPLITFVHAEKLADAYISSANSHYRDRITFASTSAKELLYLPFTQVDSRTLDFEDRLRIQLSTNVEILEKLSV